MNDLTPLPKWRQRLAAVKASLRRSKDRRRRAYAALRSAGTMGLSLAFTLLGAIMISYGVYRVYEPAGFVAGGIMCWLIVWSAEKDRGGKR